MKKRAIWVLLSCLMVISLLLASCAKSTTTSTANSTTTSTTTQSTTTTAATATTTTGTTAAVTTTATNTGHWWDAMGTPTYGGTLVARTTTSPNTWDPIVGTVGTVGPNGLQSLWQPDYTVDPNVWDHANARFSPPKYQMGQIAQSYEMPNPYTIVVKIRQDVYWWNIAPANGRQFTSADVCYHWNRCLGIGGGFTAPVAWYGTQSGYASLLSVVAGDKYTVTFNFKQGVNPYSILLTMQNTNLDRCYENPESVALYGNLNDWHHALGTGPYFLTDYVTDSSYKQTINPNYYEFDARNPQNRLPYITTRITLIIPSNVTAEAAMRVGKIDSYPSMPVQDALAMQKTNPSIVTKNGYPNNELTLDPRNDVAPFNNINVRIAMQHAIDIPMIAATLFQNYAAPWPAGLCQNQMVGYPYYPYPDWTQAEKDSYAYNLPLAKQMMADAGYANGFTTNCVLQSDCNMDLYLIIQSELLAIGIKMSITTMDPASWQGYCITSRKYDQMCARNTGAMGECVNPNSTLGLYRSGYTFNYINVTDPKIDGWYTDGMAAQSIDQMNLDIYNLVRYIVPQHYVLSLAEPLNFNMIQPWVKGNDFSAAVLGNKGDAAWLDLNLKHSLGY